MNVQGQVVSVEQNVSIQKQNGGSYQGTRFSYRDMSGKLGEQNFHNNSLKFNPKLNVALSNMKPGDSFTMVKEKEGEYWNVKDIIVGDAPVATSGTTKPAAQPAPKSNYETAEERAKRQVYIIRQSSLSTAVAALSVGAKKVEPAEVIKLAKQFEAYVFDTEYDDGSIMSLKSDGMDEEIS